MSKTEHIRRVLSQGQNFNKSAADIQELLASKVVAVETSLVYVVRSAVRREQKQDQELAAKQAADEKAKAEKQAAEKAKIEQAKQAADEKAKIEQAKQAAAEKAKKQAAEKQAAQQLIRQRQEKENGIAFLVGRLKEVVAKIGKEESKELIDLL